MTQTLHNSKIKHKSFDNLGLCIAYQKILEVCTANFGLKAILTTAECALLTVNRYNPEYASIPRSQSQPKCHQCEFHPPTPYFLLPQTQYLIIHLQPIPQRFPPSRKWRRDISNHHHIQPRIPEQSEHSTCCLDFHKLCLRPSGHVAGRWSQRLLGSIRSNGCSVAQGIQSPGCTRASR